MKIKNWTKKPITLGGCVTIAGMAYAIGIIIAIVFNFKHIIRSYKSRKWRKGIKETKRKHPEWFKHMDH